MSTEIESSFREAIRTDGKNRKIHRLVYADWLDEQGRALEAVEMRIRARCSIWRMRSIVRLDIVTMEERRGPSWDNFVERGKNLLWEVKLYGVLPWKWTFEKGWDCNYAEGGPPQVVVEAAIKAGLHWLEKYG